MSNFDSLWMHFVVQVTRFRRYFIFRLSCCVFSVMPDEINIGVALGFYFINSKRSRKVPAQYQFYHLTFKTSTVKVVPLPPMHGHEKSPKSSKSGNKITKSVQNTTKLNRYD